MCMMCVLRERVSSEKSVNSEHNFESLYLHPTGNHRGFLLGSPESLSQGMGTPSNQAKFLPLVLFFGAAGTFQKETGKSQGQ